MVLPQGGPDKYPEKKYASQDYDKRKCTKLKVNGNFSTIGFFCDFYQGSEDGFCQIPG